MDAVGRADTDVLTALSTVSERAARYDAWFTTPIGRAMDLAESEAVLALANPRPGERALDAGCGTGMYTRRLTERGAIVTGVDRDPAMLSAAHVKAPAATLVEGQITELPFERDMFDLALAVTVLCFVPKPQRAVSALVRVTGRAAAWCSPSWAATACGRQSDDSKPGAALRPGRTPGSTARTSSSRCSKAPARPTSRRGRLRIYLPQRRAGCCPARLRLSAAVGGWGRSVPRSCWPAAR